MATLDCPIYSDPSKSEPQIYVNPDSMIIYPKIDNILYTSVSKFRLESTNYLKMMISKQINNRYYNKFVPHLKYRNTVVVWLIDTMKKMKFKILTLHLSVAFYDAISSISQISVEQVKLVAFVCMFIASKYEQKGFEIPLINDCICLFQKQFSRKDFETCEALVFKLLNFRLNIVTPYHFLNFFLSQDLLCESEIGTIDQSDFKEFEEKFARECLEILHRTLLSYELYQYTSIAVAGAILAVARYKLKIKNNWSKKLENATLVSFDNIKICVLKLMALENIIYLYTDDKNSSRTTENEVL